MTLLGLAGLLVLGSFLALPQGQAFASALPLFFRGQSVQAVPVSMAQVQNAYAALDEFEQLGSLQGTIPSKLSSLSSVAAAGSMAGFSSRSRAPFQLASVPRPRRSKRLRQLT
jgi:hypothetical protein